MSNPFPTVDVVTVLWNHERFVRPLFDGLLRLNYPRDRWTMHFVDNASSDGSAAAVRECVATYPDGPNVVLHEPKTNTGFSGGNNLVMQQSTADYVFLLNPDASFERETLQELIVAAETHLEAASFQPLIVLAQDPTTINSEGNDIHFAGFGYCRGYQNKVTSAPADIRPIAYASGAGVLYRMSALRKVGFFDETLFAYHEDLDLGWRLMLAGYDNLLVPKSILRHHYEFSRSIKKWYWMERNRLIVLWKHERLATLLLMLPALAMIEIATWLFAFRGGWVGEKVRAVAWFFKPSSWSYLARRRSETQQLRVRSDGDILERFVSGITYQEVSSPFISKIANPLMELYFTILKFLVRTSL